MSTIEETKYSDAALSDKIFEAMRAAHIHHVHLTAAVDRKANILLGASLVVISGIQAWLANGNSIPYGMLVLILAASFSAFFALLTVIPRVIAVERQIPLKNPFFFGNFVGLTEEEYITQVDMQISTNYEAREYLARSIYNMGIVLAKKYNSLRYSYLALGTGILVSAVVFGFEQFFSS